MGNLGFSELLFIFVIALIFFGPRKLPELGRSLGETLAQFRRASEDFKRSWEEEVEVEKKRTTTSAAPASSELAAVVARPENTVPATAPNTAPIEGHGEQTAGAESVDAERAL
jgi:Tat protein translocase TatB subunit